MLHAVYAVLKHISRFYSSNYDRKKHLLPSLTLYSSKTATKIDTERAAFSLLGFILQKHSFMQKKKQKNGNLRVIYDHKKYYRVDLET